MIPPPGGVAVALGLPGTAVPAPATAHEVRSPQTQLAVGEVSTAWASGGYTHQLQEGRPSETERQGERGENAGG